MIKEIVDLKTYLLEMHQLLKFELGLRSTGAGWSAGVGRAGPLPHVYLPCTGERSDWSMDRGSQVLG